MLGIYRGRPAIYCRLTGECVVTFFTNARGWQEASALVKEIKAAVAAGEME